MNSLIWFPQVAERWPLLFICPSLTTGTPRQLSQRDPRDVLLPGGRDVLQSCLSHQLPLCSPSLYEESLLQHRDHVSKRNQLVDLMHWLGCALTYCADGWIWMAGPKWEQIKQIFGFRPMTVPIKEGFGLDNLEICMLYVLARHFPKSFCQSAKNLNLESNDLAGLSLISTPTMALVWRDGW